VALVSVHDKAGVVPLCTDLQAMGYSIVSTGGTAAHLEQGGVAVTKVSDVTHFPEILGGRVKTLHPHIHGGILAKRTAEHLQELQEHHISTIDIVVVNLYPFVETVSTPGTTEEAAIEQIDIGGVALLRAAAKNHRHVLVLSDPSDYQPITHALRCSNGIPLVERRRLATKAFQHTASYDTAIAHWMAGGVAGDSLPATVALCAKKSQGLRYGENPHQQGALYTWVGQDAPFVQLQGKELSYNNILDMESAWNVVRDYTDPCVAIIKHNIPCGLAVSPSGIVDAYDMALASDPVSAFGSIIACNREITLPFVERVGKLFVEVFMAEAYAPDALEWLAAHKKNCRVIVAKGAALVRPAPPTLRSVYGGLLVQSADEAGADSSGWRVVTTKQPSEAHWPAMRFAWIACKHVKSNAIVLAQGTATVGVGAGQPNRVDAVALAVKHAGDRAVGSILASDAFFPFADGIESAAAAGVSVVVQPGGSMRDDDVIKKAEELGLVMVFTGERHFRH
jgi:phosphoribosylaminoimidazolecarboxamide formyltransferase/IMP cyclohydrolase